MRDFKEFIVTENLALFMSAFVLAQDAIGEQDGGIAGMWDSTSLRYESKFANECGASVFWTILLNVSQEDVVTRMQAAETPEITRFFEDASQLSASKIGEIAAAAGQKWLEFLADTFPEVNRETILGHLPAVIKTYNSYLQAQYHYADEYLAVENSSPTPNM